MKSDVNLQIPSQKPNKALPPHRWGNTPIAKWVLSDKLTFTLSSSPLRLKNKLTFYSFIKPSQIEEQGDNDEEEEEEQEGEDSWGFECLSPRLESS